MKVKRVHKDAVLPRYAKEGDSGFDLVAVQETIIEPGQTKLIKTGLAFDIPKGYEIQVRPRSGITLKTKLRVQLGTIDAGYKGEVGVIVDNIYFDPFDLGADHAPRSRDIIGVDGYKMADNNVHLRGTHFIRKGDRIAQAILASVRRTVF